MNQTVTHFVAGKANAILFVCLLFTVLISCKNKPATADELLEKASKAPGLNAGTGTFTVTAPEGWEKKDTVMNGITFLFIKSPVSSAMKGIRPSMNVVTENMGGVSFDEYVKRNQSTMNQYFDQYKELDNGSIEANGMKGKWMRYSHAQNGYTLDNMVYMFPKNGIAYVLTGATMQGDMDKYKNTYDAIAKSLQVP